MTVSLFLISYVIMLHLLSDLL